MNPADIVILAVVGISALVSLIRGFVREVFSLLVWVLAFWVGLHFVDDIAVHLDGHIEVASVRMLLAFAGLFLLTLVVGGLMGYLLGKLVDKTGLSPTDRLLGALFGAVRGAVLVVAAVLLLGWTAFPRDVWWQESRLLPPFERLAERAAAYLPEGIEQPLEFLPPLPDQAAPPPADESDASEPQVSG